MDDGRLTTTVPSRDELDRAVRFFERIGVAFQRIDPTPGLGLVAVPALVVAPEARADLIERAADVIVSGWVPYRATTHTMPDGTEPVAPGVCFRQATIVVLQPCVADETKIRVTGMAFAVRLWSGRARLRECSPVLVPDQAVRRDALLEVCAALGISSD